MKDAQNIDIKESLAELKKLRSKQPTLLKQKRIDCLIYIKTKKFKTRQELANYLGIHIRTQERWLIKYRKGGMSNFIIDLPKNRRSKIITPEIHQELKSRVANSNNPFLGYWDAQLWIEEEFGISIKYHWLRKYLITHFGTKLKSPRKSHYKKDPEAIEAFLKTT